MPAALPATCALALSPLPGPSFLSARQLATANRYPMTTVQTIEHLLAGLEPESIELVDDSADLAALRLDLGIAPES